MSFSKARLTTLWCAASVVVLTLGVAGCFSTLASHRPIAAQEPPYSLNKHSNKTSLLSAEQRQELHVVNANGGIYEDAQLESLLAQIVRRLAASSEAPELPYRLTILNSPAINAYALPSAELFVSRGLLALANDSSEVAAVLAHEMAHVIARHAASRAEEVRQSHRLVKVMSTEVGSMAFGDTDIALATFSKNQELEADTIGIRIAASAGYDPFGAVRFLNAMRHNAELGSAAGDNEDPVKSWHPPSSERLRKARIIAEQYAARGAGTRDEAIFLAGIDGLLYGDQPDVVVQGRRLLQRKSGISFMLPEGFRLRQSGSATLGANADGSQTVRIDFVKVAPDYPLREYAASGWFDNIERASIEELDVNGFPAVTARAETPQWSYRVFVLGVDVGICRVVFAAHGSERALDQPFRQAMERFVKINRAELAATAPERLTIVTVRPGDTAEKLARRMTEMPNRLARFFVLNGLQPGQALQPGDRLKIVIRGERPQAPSNPQAGDGRQLSSRGAARVLTASTKL